MFTVRVQSTKYQETQGHHTNIGGRCKSDAQKEKEKGKINVFSSFLKI